MGWVALCPHKRLFWRCLPEVPSTSQRAADRHPRYVACASLNLQLIHGILTIIYIVIRQKIRQALVLSGPGRNSPKSTGFLDDSAHAQTMRYVILWSHLDVPCLSACCTHPYPISVIIAFTQSLSNSLRPISGGAGRLPGRATLLQDTNKLAQRFAISCSVERARQVIHCTLPLKRPRSLLSGELTCPILALSVGWNTYALHRESESSCLAAWLDCAAVTAKYLRSVELPTDDGDLGLSIPDCVTSPEHRLR